MDVLLQDLRYAARKLLRSPGFTAIVVSTLALAIGATTVVFSIVNGALLRPLPLRQPEQIVGLGVIGRNPGELGSISGPDYLDYQARNHSFVATAAYYTGNGNLIVPGASPVRLTTLTANASFFDILGVTMERGRGFAAGEDTKTAPRVVVISDKLWHSQFNADPKVLGRSISIDGKAYTVVGVAPRELVYPSAADAWLPFVPEDWMFEPSNRGAHWLSGVARLRPGVSVDACRRDMESIGEALSAEYPKSNANIRATAMSLDDMVVGNSRKTLFTMLGAVGFVLLIACANIANLLLIRASTRETEMALRTALGAGRSRIMRQLITESVLLSIAGAVIGVAIAQWGVDLVVALAPGLPRAAEIAIDGRVLAFTLGLGALTGVLFGLVPAVYTARPELSQMLRDSGRSSSARRASGKARSTFVILEVGLAMVLLVGAGLLIRSYSKLLEVNPGFRAEQVTTFNVSLPAVKYPFDRDRNRFADNVVEALRRLPGSQGAAVAMSRPMQRMGMRTVFDIDGRPPAPQDKRMVAAIRPVSAGYFNTLGISLERGRIFAQGEERFGPPPVVVVSESFAKKYFPNEDPLGKHITLGISHDTAEDNKTSVTSRGEIVGIVSDVKQNDLKEAAYPAVYLPHGTFPQSDMAFMVRSNADVGTLAAAIRKRVSEVDPEMPIYDLQTMTEAISGSVAQPRFYTTLLGAFAGLALLLAALGIYGVISYSVRQRLRELGIRIALGATNDRILRLVLRQGITLVLTGVGIGIVGAVVLMRLLSNMLFGIPATDIVTFATVPVVLAAVAILASYLPARKASRVDPMIAIRAE